MRFLFLTQYFPPEVGAPQVRLPAMIRELSRMGHELEVVTAFPNYPNGAIFPGFRGRFYQRDSFEGVPVHRTWIYPSMGGGLKRLLNYLSFTVTCCWALLRCRRADCVFVESPPLFLTIPGYVISRIWRSTFVFNVADLWPDSVEQLGVIRNGLLLRLARALESWSYRRADFVNAVTEKMKRILLNEKCVPPEKVLFFPNGVDTDTFHPMPPDIDLARQLGLEGKRINLYAGNHGYIAALETALHAAKLLETDEHLHFLFVGNGSEKQRLIALARELELQNVTFVDPVPASELPRYMSLAAYCLITLRNCSISEMARPAKTFVMMASGKPIILSAAGESTSLIRESNSGVVVPPEDPSALARAILKLEQDRLLAEQMGRNARRYVEMHFRWQSLIPNWLAQMNRQRTVGPARQVTQDEPGFGGRGAI